LLESSCGDNGTEWKLTLGAGTDREGEVVVAANQPVPFGAAPPGVSTQPAAILRQRTSATAAPELIFAADPGTLEIAADGTLSNSGGTGVTIIPDSGDSDSGFLGSSSPALLGLIAFCAMLRRRLDQGTLLRNRPRG